MNRMSFGVKTVPVIDADFFKQGMLYCVEVPGRFVEEPRDKEECGNPSLPFAIISEWFPSPGSRNNRRIALARGDKFFGVVTSVCAADILMDVYVPVVPDTTGLRAVNVHAIPFTFKAKEIADGLVRIFPVPVANNMEFFAKDWADLLREEYDEEY